MRRSAFLVVAAGAALVAGLAVGLGSGRLPLGVPGEWEWPRVRARPSTLPLGLAILSIGAYSAFVAIGLRSLRGRATWRREAGWLSGLVAAAVGVQVFVQEGAPEGHGLSKWIFALHVPGSSGYFTVAKGQMADPARFLASYPAWIAKQDALHVGTHPPGLFLMSRAILGAMEANPGLARVVVDRSPTSVSMAVRALREAGTLSRPDGAALALTGALTLLACSLSVVSLYLLARSTLPPTASWVSAAFWPVVPSALMFQPTADTAFPLLSTTALAMASWSGRAGGASGLGLATASGFVMAAGMEFTLAFLPVGLVAALIVLASPGPSWARRSGLIAATGVGFLGATLAWWAATSANPFAVWWWNQRNHARFYAEYPRNYRAWVLVNPIELAVGLGLPAVAWVLAGLSSWTWIASAFPRRAGLALPALVRSAGQALPYGEAQKIMSGCLVPPAGELGVTWATLIVLAILTLGGRNLSEVARLWLPLMPPILVAAGAGFERLGAGPRHLAASTAMVGVQALVLQSTIQVVYPF